MCREIVSPPRTIMEVFRVLPEGTLAEVIENTLYMSPIPSPQHQRIIVIIITQLLKHVTNYNLGEALLGPLDVYLDEQSNAVQPDILFIFKENIHILDEDGSVNGVPDLIIEVLSPGNKKHDLITKKSLYEKFGVKEYWIVDPETKKATGFTLKNNSYTQFAEEMGRMTSLLLNTDFIF